MSFREYLKSSIREEVIRKDKSYCELELKDGNNVFIEKIKLRELKCLKQ